MEKVVSLLSEKLPFAILFAACLAVSVESVPLALKLGFKAYAAEIGLSSFHPILVDPSGKFSLGFLRLDFGKLTVAVIHLPSSSSLWQPPLSFSSRANVVFDGDFVISDPSTASFWSTRTSGDRVSLRNNSNLVVERDGVSVWESFGVPGNTIVESQIFLANMTLHSSNGLYSLKLGETYMAMFATFNPGRQQMYWKHYALEAKAKIVPRNGAVFAVIQPEGFLGMYQTGTEPPVDVQPFNSYNRLVDGFKIARLEPDGNFKGYSWDGSQWVLEYQAVSSLCELPNPCGFYGLCRPNPGSGSCSCLDNRTDFASGSCTKESAAGNFCRGEQFETLRIKGVELPFKELMTSETAPSQEGCEGKCQRDCACWAAVYSNTSGLCFLVDYPTRTMLAAGDLGKAGFFKVKKHRGRRTAAGLGVGLAVLSVAVVSFVAAVGFAGYKIWVGRSRREGEVVRPLPTRYKNPGSFHISS